MKDKRRKRVKKAGTPPLSAEYSHETKANTLAASTGKGMQRTLADILRCLLLTPRKFWSLR